MLGCLLRLLHARRPRRAGRTITAVDAVLDGVGSRLQSLARVASRAPGPRAIDARRGAVLSIERARREASRHGASRSLQKLIWSSCGSRRRGCSRPSSLCSLSLTAIMCLNRRAAASARERGPDVLKALDSQSKNALRGCLGGVRARGQQIALRETCGCVLSTARAVEPWTDVGGACGNGIMREKAPNV